MKYFKVKFGYNADDFILIDEEEVSKAFRAQVNGTVAIFKEGSVSGKSIITVTPDINKIMGWNRTYQPTAEDYGEIPEKIMNEHKEFLTNTMLQITGGAPKDHKELPASDFSKSLSDKFRIN